MTNTQSMTTTQPPAEAYPPQEKPKSNRGPIIGIIIALIVIVAALIVGVVLLLNSDLATTGRIRDIFIIFMALESFIIGVVLVILIVQLSVLINLVQNEIKPILRATNETVNTLKGTTTFISDNLAEPVIKLNEYMAGLKKFLDLLFPSRK